MKKILSAVALSMILTGCDTSDWEFNKQEQITAEQNCSKVGGTVYFSDYQSSGNPLWAACFVQGLKYNIEKDGRMLK